jgi:parallel beta-helix repeat protein
MGRFIKSSILVLVVLTTFTFFTKAQDWLPQMPSVLLKLLPKPKFEKNNLEGIGDNGRVIDLQGGWMNEGKLSELVICSKESEKGWDVPEKITIRNGRIRGSIRIFGLGVNGEAPKVRESSHREGHTARAQAAAPRAILLEDLKIEADHRIPLYLGPGVTGVTVRNCTFTGWSASTTVYLDAESGGNRIEGCTFDMRSGREVMAVDGSATNTIIGNRFLQVSYGGIYLYRNCGEGGTVRHQAPQGNVIENNFFNVKDLRSGSYGIWLGSRQGRRSYCEDDAGYPFGSSIDNRDFADHNTIRGNIFQPASEEAVRDDGADNRVIEK